jgi:hypothetical protein
MTGYSPAEPIRGPRTLFTAATNSPQDPRGAKIVPLRGLEMFDANCRQPWIYTPPESVFWNRENITPFSIGLSR